MITQITIMNHHHHHHHHHPRTLDDLFPSRLLCLPNTVLWSIRLPWIAFSKPDHLSRFKCFACRYHPPTELEANKDWCGPSKQYCVYSVIRRTRPRQRLSAPNKIQIQDLSNNQKKGALWSLIDTNKKARQRKIEKR